eukprot:PLAT1003.1.p1 GENE.PLAT1003.1~~PLAT1003.1.p1  ORF type:complete len:172 (+),score=57.37 PLAT1003.1:24-518(+)
MAADDDDVAYDVLAVPLRASAAQIKAAYHALILEVHPDKCAASKKEELRPRFLRVQWAWEQLRTPASRAAYDASVGIVDGEFVEEEEELHFDMTVERWEMERSADGSTLSHPCRCGDTFAVAAADWHSVECVECPSCSLLLGLIHGSEDDDDDDSDDGSEDGTL